MVILSFCGEEINFGQFEPKTQMDFISSVCSAI